MWLMMYRMRPQQEEQWNWEKCHYLLSVSNRIKKVRALWVWISWLLHSSAAAETVWQTPRGILKFKNGKGKNAEIFSAFGDNNQNKKQIRPCIAKNHRRWGMYTALLPPLTLQGGNSSWQSQKQPSPNGTVRGLTVLRRHAYNNYEGHEIRQAHGSSA